MSNNQNLPKLAQNPFNVLLPSYKQVVFVDWHGVLSQEVFWSDILNNPNHRLHERMKNVCNNLFNNQKDTVDAWMRGQICSRKVLDKLELKKDKEILLTKLNDGCKNMAVHAELVSELQQIRKNSFVVIATDNMECFYNNVDFNFEVRHNFDAILCSSTLGVLKSENTIRFFKPWLDNHALDFSQAILLDDSPMNCSKFEEVGGTAILVESVKDAIHQLKEIVKSNECENVLHQTKTA